MELHQTLNFRMVGSIEFSLTNCFQQFKQYFTKGFKKPSLSNILKRLRKEPNQKIAVKLIEQFEKKKPMLKTVNRKNSQLRRHSELRRPIDAFLRIESPSGNGCLPANLLFGGTTIAKKRDVVQECLI
jgi:hypothetical protein